MISGRTGTRLENSGERVSKVKMILETVKGMTRQCRRLSADQYNLVTINNQILRRNKL